MDDPSAPVREHGPSRRVGRWSFDVLQWNRAGARVRAALRRARRRLPEPLRARAFRARLAAGRIPRQPPGSTSCALRPTAPKYEPLTGRCAGGPANPAGCSRSTCASGGRSIGILPRTASGVRSGSLDPGRGAHRFRRLQRPATLPRQEMTFPDIPTPSRAPTTRPVRRRARRRRILRAQLVRDYLRTGAASAAGASFFRLTGSDPRRLPCFPVVALLLTTPPGRSGRTPR